MHTQSVDDIMQLIIQVEKEGADFYRKLAGEVSVKAVKDVFLGLVEDEIRHQKDFMLLAQSAGKGVVIRSTIDAVEIMSVATARLRQTMKGSELVNMDEAGLKNALDIGIRNEESAIFAYSALLGVSTHELKGLLVKVIDEEKKHLQALKDIKTQRLG